VTYLAIGSTEELAGGLRDRVDQMQQTLDEEKLTAFAEGAVVHDFEEGALAVAQAHGIAGLVSNTLMLGWSDKPERRASALRLMRTAALLGKSTLICRIAPRSWSMWSAASSRSPSRRIPRTRRRRHRRPIPPRASPRPRISMFSKARA